VAGSERIGGLEVLLERRRLAMADVNRDKVPSDSVHSGETGARKYPARPGIGNVQDGISLGGTETGDPRDRPPKGGYGLTEPVTERRGKTRKSRREDRS
jgi:hypothetical protein